MPLFSIVIPTHDRPDFLAEALASVQAQRCTDFECIVVDDCSTTPAVIPGDDRFRVIRRAVNGGPAAAVNAGLAEARGDYVIRLDDDDLFTPERLDIASAGIARAPIALCWARYLDEAPSPQTVLEGDVSGRILDRVTPHMGSAAVARELFLPLDESYLGSEDVEWWLRISAHAPVATVERFGYLIRRHSGPRVLHGVAARAAGSRRMLEEHADYFAAHPRAAALRWKRIGLNELQLGNRSAARRAFLESMRARPELRTMKHLARSWLPSA